MIIVAIDPGMKGAIAFIRPNGVAGVADLPVYDDGLDRRLDGRGIYDQLLAWVPPSEACALVVEDVRVRLQGNGGRAINTMHSQTMLMRGRGIIEGVASVARLQITWCTPQKWKNHFSLKRESDDEKSSVTKARSLAMARSMFPGLEHDLRLAKHDGRAEALLMARWGQVTLL